MTGIIVTGHGHFATGISSSLDLIMGRPEHYTAVDFPAGMDAGELEQRLREEVNSFGTDADIILFTDLMGGSPFRIAATMKMENPKIHVFYGTNLGMLMETCSRAMYSSDVNEILSGIVQTGKDQVGELNLEDLQE